MNKKSTISSILVAALMLSVPFAVLVCEDPASGGVPVKWDGVAISDKYSGGAGTEKDPYRISTSAELAHMAKEINGTFDSTDKYFVLTEDIDLDKQPWTPIGKGVRKATPTPEFKGSFDGNGHTISNLKADVKTGAETSWEVTVGLFGILNGATVKNLKLDGFDIDGRNNSGALAGFVTGNTNISFVTVMFGTVDGYSGVGGVVGRMYGGTMEGCSSSAIVTSTVPVDADGKGDKDQYTHIGGIVGIASTSTKSIMFCENTGTVTGSSECTNAVKINAGGIVGAAFMGDVKYCVNRGVVTSDPTVSSTIEKNVGGIIGESTIKAYGCYDDKSTKAVKLIGKGTSEHSFFNGSSTGTAQTIQDSTAAVDLGTSTAITFVGTATPVDGIKVTSGDAVVVIFEDMYTDARGSNAVAAISGGTLKVMGFGNNTVPLKITSSVGAVVQGCTFFRTIAPSSIEMSGPTDTVRYCVFNGTSYSGEECNAIKITSAKSGVKIEFNIVDGVNAQTTSPAAHNYGRGIYVGGSGGPVEISNNSIRNVPFNAIQVTTYDGGMLTIRDNAISVWDSDNDGKDMGRGIRIDTTPGSATVSLSGNDFSKTYDTAKTYDYSNIIKISGNNSSVDLKDNTMSGKTMQDNSLKTGVVWVDHDYVLKEELTVKAGTTYVISGNYVIDKGFTLTNNGVIAGNGIILGNVVTGSGIGHPAMQHYLLDFTTNPTGATIVLKQNGSVVPLYDGSQFAVKTGTYEYTVSAAGYYTQSGDVTIGSTDQTKDVSLSAIVIPGGSTTDKKTETVTNPDGTQTEKEAETVTNPDGTQTEKVTQTEKDKDGKITEVRQTVSIKDDKTGVVTEAVNTTDASGKTVSESKTTMEVEQKSSAGKATAFVSDESMKKAIEQINAARKSSGPESTSVIIIDAKSSDPSKETRSVNVDMSADSLAALLKADAELEVSTDVGKLTFDQDVLKNLSTKPGESVSMSISDIEKSTLTEEQRSKAGDNPVFSLSAAIGENKVHDLGGLATITLPYALKEGQDPGNVKVYYLDDEGGMKEYLCEYDPATETVSFITDHFSYFVLAYDVPGGSGGNAVMYIAVAVIAIIIAALAVGIYIRRRNDGAE